MGEEISKGRREQRGAGPEVEGGEPCADDLVARVVETYGLPAIRRLDAVLATICLRLREHNRTVTGEHERVLIERLLGAVGETFYVVRRQYHLLSGRKRGGGGPACGVNDMDSPVALDCTAEEVP